MQGNHGSETRIEPSEAISRIDRSRKFGRSGSIVKKKPRFKIVIDNENEPPPIEYAPVSRAPVNDCMFDDGDPQKIAENIFKKKSRKLPDRRIGGISLEIISNDFGLDEPVPPLDDLGDDDFSFPWAELIFFPVCVGLMKNGCLCDFCACVCCCIIFPPYFSLPKPF